MYILILFILLLILLLYYPLQDIYLIYIKGLPPGPISLPLIGNLHLLNSKTPHLSVDELYNKYGSVFSLRMGPYGRVVFMGSIEAIDELSIRPELKNRPRLAFMDIISEGADGIGSCKFDGEKWKYLVRVFKQGQANFSNYNLSQRVVPYIEQLVERFKENADKSYDPSSDISKATAAIFGSIVYGVQTESLDCRDLESRMENHSKIMSGLNVAHILNIVPSVWKIPSPLKTTLLGSIKHRDDIMAECLKRHIEEFDGDYKDMMDIIANSVLHHAVRTKSHGTSVQDMLLSLWTFYLAGYDTVQYTILWILLYLCINKDIQEKIHQELDSVLSDTNDVILDRKPYLHYTRAFILESLRLSSTTAMGIPNYSLQEAQLLGHYIPKDTVIMPTQWTVHHNPNYWQDPFKLKPERFLDEEGKLLPNQHIKKMPFIPFSRGLRVCLGQHMALDMLLMFTCKTLKSCSVRLSEDCKPNIDGEIEFSLKPHKYQVLFHNRT